MDLIMTVVHKHESHVFSIPQDTNPMRGIGKVPGPSDLLEFGPSTAFKDHALHLRRKIMAYIWKS